MEAPPPKVNPWTKNALPPVLATVNGQSPPGGSPFGIPGPGASSGDIGVPSQRPPGPGGPPQGRGDSGFFFFSIILANSGRRALPPSPPPPHPSTLGNLPLPQGPASREATATAWAAAVSGQRRGPAYLAGRGRALLSGGRGPPPRPHRVSV